MKVDGRSSSLETSLDSHAGLLIIIIIIIIIIDAALKSPNGCPFLSSMELPVGPTQIRQAKASPDPPPLPPSSYSLGGLKLSIVHPRLLNCLSTIDHELDEEKAELKRIGAGELADGQL